MERVKESFGFSGGTVDETGPYPIVRGVLICGLTSVHGYDYDARCWENGRAKQLYEGQFSYDGHKDGERAPSEKVGWWENVRTRPDGRPEGDYCLNPEHPLCKGIIWAAKHKPDFYKLSHVADVNRVKRPNGRTAVESIGKVYSIDLVDTGGTTASLWESGHNQKGTAVAVKVKEYANKLGTKCTVEQLLRLRALVKEDGFGDAPMSADAPDPAAEGTAAEDGITAAFKSAFDMVRDKLFAGQLDRKSAFKKLAAIFNGHSDAQDATGAAADDTSDDPAADTAAKESGKGKPVAPDPWAILGECEREGFKPTALDLKMLSRVQESGDRLEYIRHQKQLSNATDPKSASRQQLAGGEGKAKESGAGGGGAASGAEEARQVMAQLSKDARGAN